MTSRGDGAANSQLHCGDNLLWMSGLPDACCDLIYIDPPFFTRRSRNQSDGAAGFTDNWTGGLDAYRQYMTPRLAECHRLLADHGTLYVHLDWHVSHHVRVKLDALFGAENFLNEIIWHYRTGGVSKRWFGRKHDTILVYARQLGRHRFNVQRGGQYRTDGLNYDDNGRPYKTTRRGKLYFNEEGPVLTDVWDIPFLSTVSLERTGWPSQKPEALLDRIIRAGSDPGDVVADFFCGSGTTAVVAKRLGRRWLACDESAEAVAIAEARLAAVKVASPSHANPSHAV